VNSKWKYALVGLVVAGLGLTVLWRLSGDSLARIVKQQLLQTAATSVTGDLSVGTSRFSMSGSLGSRPGRAQGQIRRLDRCLHGP